MNKGLGAFVAAGAMVIAVAPIGVSAGALHVGCVL